jgi:membrane fusion protein, protease secretion system
VSGEFMERFNGTSQVPARVEPELLFGPWVGVDPIDFERIERPDTRYAGVLRLGLAVLILGFGGFFAWASLVPLDEGIPAAGTVVVETSRQRIDPLNGGVVEQILVREGQVVKAGQELVVLNETQSKPASSATHGQWLTALATQARLQAERTGAAAIAWPAALVAERDNPDTAALMIAQEGLFRSRRLALEGELRLLQESTRGLEQQLASLDRLKAGRQTQLALSGERLESFRNLHKEGFVSRNHLLELERQFAELQGKQSEDLSNIAGINARLAELRMQGAQREMEYRREVEAQLADLQREIGGLSERLSAQRETFERVVLRAPVDGTVVEMALHTLGGVVKPGDRVMDIVPQGDPWVIEARVSPQYMDRLAAGLPADVRFDAYAGRGQRPVVSGQVASVSAEALVDARTGASYYALRVRVPPTEATKLGDLELQTGMLATVRVKTGRRTLMAYLFRP